MPSRPVGAPSTRALASSVYLRPPARADTAVFLAAVKASRGLHLGWVQPPASAERYAAFVARYGAHARTDPRERTHAGYLVLRRDDDALVGVFNLSEIVRGAFQSGYLGYYSFAPHAGAGYMSGGLALVLAASFRTLRLHRVEANVQPTNARSIALVERAGFVREGYSRRYVKIAGRWRDHVRFALLAEDWRESVRRTR
jgi:[ribosomal protein S5]-alanine N-acetyltransferase